MPFPFDSSLWIIKTSRSTEIREQLSHVDQWPFNFLPPPKSYVVDHLFFITNRAIPQNPNRDITKLLALTVNALGPQGHMADPRYLIVHIFRAFLHSESARTIDLYWSDG